ncbi:hypothetical protein PanWU01x14_134680 [Parasponia andersonii]|uniref:Uncharacterized protein n=1 Tax=Parasponia andersonii TaxID=3476 RepID=A0A2P5CPR8_PARAD|nr:hypothetical protein PanWU01x14_134680 [Parasponia andersonii]
MIPEFINMFCTLWYYGAKSSTAVLRRSKGWHCGITRPRRQCRGTIGVALLCHAINVAAPRCHRVALRQVPETFGTVTPT